MNKMTKGQAKRRLREASDKILKVMLAGHMTASIAVKISEQLDKASAKLK